MMTRTTAWVVGTGAAFSLALVLCLEFSGPSLPKQIALTVECPHSPGNQCLMVFDYADFVRQYNRIAPQIHSQKRALAPKKKVYGI